jgi:Zn-dependent peptidase ImmA (M78 family)
MAEQVSDPKLTTVDVKPLGASAAREIGTFSLKTKGPMPKEVTGNTSWCGRRLEATGSSQPISGTTDVDVRVLDFAIRSLDALAVWGPKHGPAVLLNKTSNRIPATIGNIWRSGALRVTAAHELCHLLLDSKHTLSAVDVLGGRMPLRIEQRAKAFAAGFLLPSQEAADLWKAEGNPLDALSLYKLIKKLCRRHNVTESVAAWQLQHGASADNWEELDRALDEIVPQR